MSTSSGGTAGTLPTIRLGEWDFDFVETLAPALDAAGGIEEFSPQEQYMGKDAVPLHKHGHGTFCSFSIAVLPGREGVYALVVDGSARYIGECEDLRKRFNVGYGHISPRNCYRRGQSTNCKINHRVLGVSKAGGRVNLYFYQTTQRHTVEERLIAGCSPPWNG